MHVDGACLGNPGPGGYAAVLQPGRRRKEIAGGFASTTNNRMELMAAIAGLEALTRPCRVIVYSDSEYVVKGIANGWARAWRSNGWKRRNNERALSADLWLRLLNLCEQHNVSFHWVRGHAGNPQNELCDSLAAQAAQAPGLPPDPGYKAAPTVDLSHATV
jgi:ribonuclease HI